MRTYNGYPIFLASLEDENPGIFTISLVDEPAMELPMFCFSKEEKKFCFADESKHNIISCICRVDFPVLRLTAEGNPCYVVFSKETSERLCQKLMTEGFQQCISLDHNGELISGIQLQEVFIKDSAKGLNPAGYEDAADGSLFGIYHITDENLWNDCVEGRFGGVSLESYFRLEQFNKINNRLNMSKIKKMLKAILMEFNNLSTDKAELFWEEDSELEVGMKVYVKDQEGNNIPAEDGEYTSDENVIKVENGVVTEISDNKAEETETEETTEEPKEEMAEEPAEETGNEEPAEEPAEEPENDKVAELENRVAELEAKVEELITKIAEIASAPASEPVVDEFEKVTKKATSGDKRLDKRIALAKALREN